MQTFLLGVLWIASVAAALYAAERLVQSLASLGRDFALSSAHLGFLVALGADAPELTSAFIALAGGAAGIGLGVVAGSNIYNLAGLLGLTALLAGGIASDRFRLVLDGGANLAITIVLVVLLQIPAEHFPLSLLLIVLLLAYVGTLSIPRSRLAPRLGMTGGPPPTEGEEQAPLPFRQSIIVSVLSVLAIVAASDVLVHVTIQLGPRLHVPAPFLSDVALPVATSLPNTWAAYSLARKGLARAAVAATFNSNSINAGLGVGVPGLFIAFHVSPGDRILDAWWLLGMTVVAIVLLATRARLQRWEGGLLVALYAGFVVARLTVF